MRNLIAILAISLSLCSCGRKKQEKPVDDEPIFDRYVYIDRTGCLHTKKTCFELSSYECESKNYQINFARIDTISRISSFCSKCVTIEQFDVIDRIAKDNAMKAEDDGIDFLEQYRIKP